MDYCQEATQRLDELLFRIAQAMSIQNPEVRVAALEALRTETEKFKNQLLPPSAALRSRLAIDQPPSSSVPGRHLGPLEEGVATNAPCKAPRQ
jgi:hypothetical protein